jgi:hypothetical protein
MLPDLRYSAGLVGYGSDVLGFGTTRFYRPYVGTEVLLFLDEKGIALKDSNP